MTRVINKSVAETELKIIVKNTYDNGIDSNLLSKLKFCRCHKDCLLMGEFSAMVLALVLMASSLLKAVNVHSFAAEVMLYSEAYIASALVPFRTQIACLVCSCELFLALLLLHHRYQLIASFISLALLSFFTLLTGMNVFKPSVIGSIESCGCFGEYVHFTPIGAFVKSVILLGISTLCLLASYKVTSDCMLENKVQEKSQLEMLVSLLMSISLPICSLLGMKLMDADTYILLYVIMSVAIVGYAIRCCIILMHEFWRIDNVSFDRVRKEVDRR